MTFHFNRRKNYEKACKILTEKEYEYIKNYIQNIAVNVREYRFILNEQMNQRYKHCTFNAAQCTRKSYRPK